MARFDSVFGLWQDETRWCFYGRITLGGVRYLAGLDSLVLGLWQDYTCRCFYGRIRLVRVRVSQDSKHA